MFHMARLAAASGSSEGASTGMRRAQDAIAPIVLYHRFDPHLAATPWTMVTGVFQEQINWLGENDYRDATVYTEMFPIIKTHRVPQRFLFFPTPFRALRTR